MGLPWVWWLTKAPASQLKLAIMTSNRASDKSSSSNQAGYMQEEVFKPDRAHILAALLLSAIALLGIGWMEWYWWWLFILPVVFVLWILKSRTTVNEDGIAVTSLFRGTKRISWSDFAGIEFKRTTYAVDKKGSKLALPGVTFNSLPQLASASRGRIPDALTAGRQAAEEKVKVVHRDGHEVLMTKDEYEAHQAQQARKQAAESSDVAAKASTKRPQRRARRAE